MTRCRIAACALVLAGCGRFGFDGTSTDAAHDVPADVAPALQTVSVSSFAVAGATFVDIPGSTVNIPAAVGVRFLILTSAQLESSVAAGVTVEARYLIDGVERGLGGTENSVPNRPGPWQHAEVLEGDGAPHTLAYQLRDASGGTATIHHLSSLVIPLPAAAVTYGRSDPPQDVTTASESPHVPLALGALSGDYTFFLVVNATDLPAESDVYVQWRGPAGEIWLRDSQQPREAWQSFFVVQRATVDVASAVVTLYTHNGSSGLGRVRDVRAIAVRNDAFASVAFARDDNNMPWNMAAPMVGAQVDPPPLVEPASRFVFISSMSLDEECGIPADAERAVHIVADLTTTVLVHSTDNCAYQPTYGMMQVLPALPAHVSIGYSTLGGDAVNYRGSQVLVLGLR